MGHPTLSTHVLDLASGQPVPGVRVDLFLDATLLHSQRTDADGRIHRLGGEQLATGAYRLVFEVGEHYKDREHLFERVTYDLGLSTPRHHHVPLLVSPFSCTTYRGS